MSAAAALNNIARAAVGIGASVSLAQASMYNVDGGHRAVMYDKIRGVLPQSVGEGTGFKIPMVQEPIIMDVRSRPKEIRSITGTKDLQMVNIYLRVLSRPRVDKLPVIFQKYNTNWEDRVIPSIGNEVLKSVVAQYNAEQLLSMREQISFPSASFLDTKAAMTTQLHSSH